MNRLPAAIRGALWMGGALVSLSAMAIGARELLHRMGSFEILFLRSAGSLLILLPILARVGLARVRTRRFGLHAVRNLLHLAGQYAWVYALGMLPLATVFAIEFTMPVWTAILAVPLLGERLNRGRVVMLVLGFAGILLILKPGFGVLQPAALVMLAGSFSYALTTITTKRLSQSESALAVVFYMAVVQMPFALVPALPTWVAPVAADWPWIVVVGAAGLAANFCMARALRVADAALVAPIDFLRLPLIAAVGAIFYDERIDLSIMAGAAIIFAGTWYSIRRESRRLPRPVGDGG
jgi:drug/metabolite transporter (DMT)-like permease